MVYSEPEWKRCFSQQWVGGLSAEVNEQFLVCCSQQVRFDKALDVSSTHAHVSGQVSKRVSQTTPFGNSVMGKRRQVAKSWTFPQCLAARGTSTYLCIQHPVWYSSTFWNASRHCKDQNCPPSTSSLRSHGLSPAVLRCPGCPQSSKETWTEERGDAGVSKYLLLEPTKAMGITAWAGSSSSICSPWAASATAPALAAQESSSGHPELLGQQYFSDACEVITNSSSHCPLMEGGLINYITLSQLSMLWDNHNAVSPSSKVSSKLATTPCV